MKLSQFKFELPEELIAQEPLKTRHDSRLLVVHSKERRIEHRRFHDILDIFDEGDVFVVNNTKVFTARMYGQKEKTGAQIEVFLLRELNHELRLWDVLVDPARKIRVGNKLYFGDDDLVAEVVDNTTSRGRTIRFLFDGTDEEFHKTIDTLGETPLLKEFIERPIEPEDRERYQTVFSKFQGSVAAPTASLHFTEEVIAKLIEKGIEQQYLTLHVGAGTFKPVTADNAADHEMHKERFQVNSALLHALIARLDAGESIIATGTTTMRVLESLHYVGERIHAGKANPTEISADSGFDPGNHNLTIRESLDVVLRYSEKNGGVINGNTAIFILPGFRFRLCSGLITNFHQPGSTLIALVAAFIGEDWRNVYAHALKKDYRFLSYGDSSLLYGTQNIVYQ
jgi:S-adenosylmethionine:tRNA ribosyltransferase-isomerase